MELPLPEKFPKPTQVHAHQGEPCPRCETVLEAVFYEDYVMTLLPVLPDGGPHPQGPPALAPAEVTGSRSSRPTRRAGRTCRRSSARAAIRRGAGASGTRCSPRESWASVGAEELAFRLREQTDCGHPESAATSGLVAYLDGEPVGWCAVEPRTAYPRLLLKTRVPWDGRAEDKADESVWAVTCFVTRAGFRRRGVSRALARAAVGFARERGARALEGYPMITKRAEITGESSTSAAWARSPAPGSPRSAGPPSAGS